MASDVGKVAVVDVVIQVLRHDRVEIHEACAMSFGEFARCDALKRFISDENYAPEGRTRPSLELAENQRTASSLGRGSGSHKTGWPRTMAGTPPLSKRESRASMASTNSRNGSVSRSTVSR